MFIKKNEKVNEKNNPFKIYNLKREKERKKEKSHHISTRYLIVVVVAAFFNTIF